MPKPFNALRDFNCASRLGPADVLQLPQPQIPHQHSPMPIPLPFFNALRDFNALRASWRDG